MSILIGLGLAAACGFRIFVPMLALSIASYAGHVTLAPAFAWIGSVPALIAFSVATVLEIGGYYIPWIDNLLDTIATPAAVMAGTIVTASMLTGMSPFLQWCLAIIAGGGIAGIVQASTVAARAVSTASSAGTTNSVVATVELGLSSVLSVLSVLVPWLAVLAIIAVAGLVTVRIRRKRKASISAAAATATEAAPPLVGSTSHASHSQ